MSDRCRLPEFSIHQAAAAAEALFGLSGTVTPLDGERDLNYLIAAEQQKYVFKIANQHEKKAMLECQNTVFSRLAQSGKFDHPPSVLISRNGQPIECIQSSSGVRHYCRVIRFIEGKVWSSVNPKTGGLLEHLGVTLAQIDEELTDFQHPALERPLLWDMRNAPQTICRFLPLIKAENKRQLIRHFQRRFEEWVLPTADQLPRSVIHNDANDHNILVTGQDPWQQTVAAIIDFGDMITGWTVTDLAVAAAYAILDQDKPLDTAAAIIRGYHQRRPLTEAEIRVLYPLLCMRLSLSVAISAYQQALEPTNDYLTITETPAWDMLTRLREICPKYAYFVFRDACGLTPNPHSPAIVDWLARNTGSFHSIVDADLKNDPLLVLDLGVSSPHLGNPSEKVDPLVLGRQLFRAIEDSQCVAGIGRYAEYRLLYDSALFSDVAGHRRTLHLGIDLFLAAGSRVYAPLDGIVHALADHPAPLDYGGTLILEHRVPPATSGQRSKGIIFYTLYVHLKPASLSPFRPGEPIKAGQCIAEIGDSRENGGWPPHVHFQIMTDMLNETDTFVGVGSHVHCEVWMNVCPDPNLILAIPDRLLGEPRSAGDISTDQMVQNRHRSLNPALSLSYRVPIHMARGGMQYLYDHTGRQYLDAVNNVPHVGHCHPSVVEAERRQAGVLNTNTRYLYRSLARYSERLLETFPNPLSVVFFTNSGSEANDLALRLVWNYTGRKDLVILDHAYHGNLTTLIDISPYKHDGKGGCGPPGHVHKVAIPDRFRGLYRLPDGQGEATACYAGLVAEALKRADRAGGAAAFMCESMLSCAGQIELPTGYLKAVYAQTRVHDALCIADEVQVGFGRMGSHFWAFETQDVVPDIVTLGKPMGNGYPLAAVITTRDIADAFNNGMEYFNTFGGNPVSASVGLAVLDVIEQEGLQHNAARVGTRLLHLLRDLQARYPIIGEVRGRGLFLGIELVEDMTDRAPATQQASYVVERMKQCGILISTDGPHANVLKIKPPMCFTAENARRLADMLEKILAEDFSQPGAFDACTGRAPSNVLGKTS